MATGRKPNSRPGEKKKIHATHFKVPNGGMECGYKAGDMHGVNGHRTHAHQPCLKLYTNGEMECPYCNAGLEPMWRGYVPVWDRDWTLRYALIGEEIFESVDIIPRGAQVVLTRAKNPISPLVIRQETKLVRSLPDKEPWTQPVCMEDICLLLWKLPALTAWVHRERELRSALPAGVAVKSDGKAFSPPMQAAAKRNGSRVVKEEEAIPFSEALNRVKALEEAGKLPKPNGNHSKK
jgi:hypothetical protein